MLKIKDNVDLKELEKFNYDFASDGKTYCKDTKYSSLWALFNYGVGTRTIFIDYKTRRISEIAGIGAYQIEVIEEDIEDLINADLVEKVDE